MKTKKLVSILLSISAAMNTFGYVFAEDMVETTNAVSEVTESEVQNLETVNVQEETKEVVTPESSVEISTVLPETTVEVMEEIQTTIGNHEEYTSEAVVPTESSEPETTESVEESNSASLEEISSEAIETAEEETESVEEETETTEEESTEEETSEAEEPSHAVTNGMMTGGYILSSADQNVPVHQSGISTYSLLPAAYPDTYQNSVAYISSKYPENRDQNPYGTCWAFSSLGLAEFDLINKGVYTSANDLSELQLAYFTYNSVLDPLGGTEGDVSKYHEENTSTCYLNVGGNYEMAARRLMQWIGAVNESEVPYSEAKSTIESGLPEEYAYNHDVAHLDNAYIINIKNDAEGVKQNIIDHGAVGVMYYHNDYSMLWNSDYNLWTYYDTAYSGGGHAVMIVGWDDNFSKDLFPGTTKPANDGAWLVRNSWGLYCNYFWMSYDSYSLSESAWAFDFYSGDEYDNNYQCDGGNSSYYNTQYSTLANVFEVPSKAENEIELLEAVSVSFTHVADVTYTIEIYTDLTKGSDPTSGTKQVLATTTGKTSYAGIYTVPLESSVELKPGSKFSVVVSTDKPALDYEQAASTADFDKKLPIWDNPVSYGNNKSFFFSGNKFYTWPWGNECIKAFTVNRTVSQSYSISYELNGGENNAANPSSYTVGSGAIVLQDPSREGYRFEGWYLDADYNTQITEIPEGAAQNYIVYAKWEKLYILTVVGGTTSDGLTEAYYTAEESVTIKADAAQEGYVFVCWKQDGDLVSSETEYQFNMPERDTELKAVFEKDTTVTVIFTDYNSNVISTDVYSLPIANNSDIRVPSSAAVAGYEWKGWKLGDAIYSANEIASVIRRMATGVSVITVESVYEQKEEIYSLTVKNGSISDGKTSGQYRPSTLIIVNAAPAETGKKFAYWLKDGAIASYNECWHLFMPERDTSIEAVYQEENESIDSVGISYIESVEVDSENKKLSFVSIGIVPTGCVVKFCGIVATSDKNIAKNLTSSNATYVRGGGEGNSNCKYKWTKGNVGANQIWYVRSYLKYTDQNGAEHEIYGDVVSSSLAVTVTFTGFNSALLSNEAYLLSDTDIKVPKAIYIDGYVWKGWVLDGTLYATSEEIVAAIRSKMQDGSRIIVSSEYQQNEQLYTVTVKNGTFANGLRSGEYKQSELVTVTADEAATGKKFAYWLKDGVVASYDATWRFYMPGRNTEVEAVYEAESDQTETEAVTYIESIAVDASKNKIMVVSIGRVPTGAVVEVSGVVATNDSTVASNLTADNAIYVRGGGKGYSNCKYTWTKGSVTEGQIWYVRSYLKYTDANGVSQEVYGELKKVSLEGEQE